MQGPGEGTSGGLWGAGMGCVLVYLEKGSSGSGISTGWLLLLSRPGSGGNALQTTLFQGFLVFGAPRAAAGETLPPPSLTPPPPQQEAAPSITWLAQAPGPSL